MLSLLQGKLLFGYLSSTSFNADLFVRQDSLRKKQQPPVGSTPVSVPSPQPSPTFSPAITIPSAAQPTVQSLQQQHNEIKEV